MNVLYESILAQQAVHVPVQIATHQGADMVRLTVKLSIVIIYKQAVLIVVIWLLSVHLPMQSMPIIAIPDRWYNC